MHSNSNHSQPNPPSLNHTQPASPAHLQTSVDHAITNSAIGVAQVPHAFSTKTANTQTLTRNKGGLKSSIIPVWLSTSPNSDKEHLVYAPLDNMSDTTFISDTVADILDIPHQSLVNLKINTVNPTNHNASTQSRLFKELTIKGFYADQHISLVDVYTIPEIPLNRSHIPTKESAAVWDHLQHIAHEIPELQNCPIGMLIGYDNSHALIPLKSVAGPNARDPYAVQTPLGWSVVGATNPHKKHEIVRLSNSLQSSADVNAVSFACFSKPLKSTSVLHILQQDFRENQTIGTRLALSQDDKKFLETGISQTEDGMPLTPNHLLTTKSKIIFPRPGQFDESYTYSQKRWRVVQSLANQFWSKWREKYIANLQPRQKWLQLTNSILTGDTALLSDDNTSRCSWPIARVREVIPSKDGIIRKVKVVVANATRWTIRGYNYLLWQFLSAQYKN
ncbi:hypothetical protein EB796_015203 [Bugula neritina]|uniref:DUF5641 domain-containing protein n=1 Tax=Bugula neritina TaxID=10212 RepID=A0A7J7JM74_BUGNE|nr:hypothetical protein EB796_015203 [Bugula neritina]